MAPPKTLPPLFCVCERKACGKVFKVSSRHEQARRKFCSRVCQLLERPNLTPEATRRGGRTHAKLLQRAVLHRVTGLTPLEAFRLGYTIGLGSKTRQRKRRAPLEGRA